MAYYRVTDTQLSSIANIMRSRYLEPNDVYYEKGIGKIGKNLYGNDMMARVTPGGTYTVSIKIKKKSTQSGTTLAIRFRDDNNTQISNEDLTISINTSTFTKFTKTVTAPEGATRLYMSAGGHYSEEAQIELGSTATAYEPYRIGLAFPEDFITLIADMCDYIEELEDQING